MISPANRVGDDRPVRVVISRGVVLGLLALGSVSIMMAFWLLLPPDLQRAIAGTWANLIQENLGLASGPIDEAGMASDSATLVIKQPVSQDPEAPGNADLVATTADAEGMMPLSVAAKSAIAGHGQPQAQAESLGQLATVPAALEFHSIQPCPPIFSVSFEHDSSTVPVADWPEKVVYLRNWLDRHPQATVVIEGYTDASGAPEYNLLLSYRRAQAVATVLAKAGLPGDRLVTQAFGAERFLEGIAASSAQNRRVSVRTEGANECPTPH